MSRSPSHRAAYSCSPASIISGVISTSESAGLSAKISTCYNSESAMVRQPDSSTADPEVAITHGMRSYRKLVSRDDPIKVTEVEKTAADIGAFILEFSAFLKEFKLL